MGDPRKLTNKYESPRKVWDADRIRREGNLKAVYGLKNTREVWGTLLDLKKARGGAMKMLALGEEGRKKAQPLINRLSRLGIVPADAKLDDVLSLTVENFLDRRLQTRVMKKGLARTAKQSRQLITHGFIAIKGRKVTIPSYIVTANEEEHVSYYKPVDISVHVAEDKPKPSAKPPEQAPAPTEATDTS